MAEPVSYFNGDFVPDSECRIHISDRGFRRGDTIYDVSRTFGGRVHRLGEHLDRLYRSLKYSRIEPGMTQNEMEEVTHEVIRRNPPPDGGDCVVWHTLVRGYAPSPARINTPTPATLCIQVKPHRIPGLRPPVQRRRSRYLPPHPQLPLQLPRAQAQALQSHEFLHGRA